MLQTAQEGPPLLAPFRKQQVHYHQPGQTMWLEHSKQLHGLNDMHVIYC